MSGIDSLTEFYVHENMQLLEKLEVILLVSQIDGKLGKEEIEEIFRTMHTIKGSSAMMGYDSLTKLTHSIEDVFDEIRNGLELSNSKWEEVVDVVLAIIDFLKSEMLNIQEGLLPEASIDELHERALGLLKNNHENNEDNKTLDIELPLQTTDEKYLCIKVFFESGCGMEGIRALGVATMIDGLCSIAKTIPEDLNVECDDDIVKDGFTMYVKTIGDKDELQKAIEETMFLKSLEIVEVTKQEELESIFNTTNSVSSQNDINEEVAITNDMVEKETKEEAIQINNHNTINDEIAITSDVVEQEIKEEVVHPSATSKIKDEISNINSTPKKEIKEENVQSHISNKNSYLTVNINKVDTLMNLVGEIVTTESMVEKQSQLENFDPESFEKQARRLHQLTNELQDVVMSIRMVPISSTFTKMQRVVRDMSKKTGKLVDLVLIGEQTEVDKNILENISDPLMHMIRNSMDHGVEMPHERRENSKPEKATITLEAKNTGGDVVIVIKDDGRGLDKEAIVKKAIEKGITSKSIDEISDKEAYNFILAPGFSTKEAVTEYSGRGVGMDVVYTNIRKLRGAISIDSEKGKGTMFVLRIPLTLAIVDGMKVQIGDEIYIIPSLNIKEVFRHGAYEIVKNPNGEEHSIIRGNCYEIRRLSKILDITPKSDEGIMILVESEMGNVCIIVDSIIGQQQVVIKPIPTLLTQFEKVQSYMAGCSILEDGSISLIFDVNAIINK